jgi:hypothetical protein
MSILLQFNVKPGDVFRYRSTFTPRGSGRPAASSVQSNYRVEAVQAGSLHVMLLEDPNSGVMAYDRRGYPVDVLVNGVSIKADMPGEVFDISNRLIFPERPVEVGDSWEADDGTVHVSYRLVAFSAPRGRQAAEIHATTEGYTGPLKYWVEVSTGWLMRQEYTVGGSSGTTTIIERQ